ncbi:hypothetical protein C8J57DRAFT_1504822 [Mycena rebaudengoi]|nr:hypothetical protein C8J57DRAFT_1504822 [Mycena rebaudengoi]
MWYRLTDGEVSSPIVFTQKTIEVGMANIPVIFVIVNKSGPRPSTLDTSIGVSVFVSAPDTVIIHKAIDTDSIFVMAAKGAFDVLTEGFEIDLDEAAFKAALKSAEIRRTANGEDHSAIDLGRAWQAKHGCLVDMDTLLAHMTAQSITKSEFLDLLEEETFHALALVCKMRRLLPNLHAWLIARKRGRPWWRFGMSLALRAYSTAHCPPNLEDYHARLNNSQPSPLLPRVNCCLATLTSLGKSGYGADILDRRSNRAMRATLVLLRQHHHVASAQGLNKLGANTTDFALSFPLTAGAAQDNAMLQMSPERGSMYNEPIAAVLPLKKYVCLLRHSTTSSHTTSPGPRHLHLGLCIRTACNASTMSKNKWWPLPSIPLLPGVNKGWRYMLRTGQSSLAEAVGAGGDRACLDLSTRVVVVDLCLLATLVVELHILDAGFVPFARFIFSPSCLMQMLGVNVTPLVVDPRRF